MDAREYLKSSCSKISDDTITSFIAYCDRMKTAIQRQHYAKLLGSVCSFARCDYRNLHGDQVALWLENRRQKLSERTFAGELAALRSLFRVMDEDLHTDIFSSLSFIDAKKVPMSILSEDVPSLSDADRILEASKDNPELYLAIVLALRCALNITDIVSLKSSMFFFDKDGIAGFRFTGLSTEREGNIRIPDDVVTILSKYIEEQSIEDWLFPSRQRPGHHSSARWMQMQLNKACNTAGLPSDKKVTFRSLRALAIVDMLDGGAGTTKVAQYVSMNESNLHYYGAVVPELKNSAVEHSRIRVIGPSERGEVNG